MQNSIGTQMCHSMRHGDVQNSIIAQLCCSLHYTKMQNAVVPQICSLLHCNVCVESHCHAYVEHCQQ